MKVIQSTSLDSEAVSLGPGTVRLSVVARGQ